MPVYTVSQVARYVKETLDRDRVLGDLYTGGEVSNYTHASSGHWYFSVKDGSTQLRCMMFSDGFGAEHLRNGAAVTVHGRISFYGARGELQYYVDLVQPEGVGELYMEFLRVKSKLEAEGLFDPARKRPIPAFPRRICVVTSRTGAVLHDMQNVLSRRFPIAEVHLVHTPVQGDQAPEGIVAALKAVGQQNGIDLVILARGGGSIEELAAYNREEVARAIHGCPFPVISGVGHETDYTIADFVADLRAPTPSAAAEMATPDMRDLRRRLESWTLTLRTGIEDMITSGRRDVMWLAARAEQSLPEVGLERQRVADLVRSGVASLERSLSTRVQHVRAKGMQLEALHPGHTLDRGYALVEKPAGGLVSRVRDVQAGQELTIKVSDGDIGAKVASGRTPMPTRPLRKKRSIPSDQPALWD